MNWIRIFIPSWRFFDELGHIALVSHRFTSVNQNEFSDWQNSTPKPTHLPAAFLFNPSGNLYLATQSLVNQLMSDIQQLGSDQQIEDFVSFELLKRHVIQQIRRQQPEIMKLQFQFRIQVTDPNHPEQNYEALLSKVYDL